MHTCFTSTCFSNMKCYSYKSHEHGVGCIYQSMNKIFNLKDHINYFKKNTNHKNDNNNRVKYVLVIIYSNAFCYKY